MDVTAGFFCHMCGADHEEARTEVIFHMMVNQKVQLCRNCIFAVVETYEKRHGVSSYKSSKREKVVHVSNGKRKKVHERDFYRCVKCGTHKDLTIDHIIPSSKGGENTIENMQTLCFSCNAAKGAR